jgi:hypothetical protein
MLLLGFAPVFMAIGIFNKGIFFSWLKTTMNYFLLILQICGFIDF